MIKNGDNVILKFSTLGDELSRYVYESMDAAKKYCYHNETLVEYAPVKHGQWVYDHWCEFKCSICGQFSDSKPHKGKENYCPNCGAKMDKKDG